MICVLELVCNFFITSHLNLRPTSPHVLTLASILLSRAAIKADTWVFERVIGWVVMICVLELVYTFYIGRNRTYGLSFWCINARTYEPLNWVIESHQIKLSRAATKADTWVLARGDRVGCHNLRSSIGTQVLHRKTLHPTAFLPYVLYHCLYPYIVTRSGAQST